MKSRKLVFAAVASFACCAALAPLVLPTPVAAQSAPTAGNVIPDGGRFAIKGKVQAIDPGAGTITIGTDSNGAVPLVVAPGVSLEDITVGDIVSGHYSRTVTFVIAGPNVSVAPVAPSTTVGHAVVPGAIGPAGGTIVGRVVKRDGPNSFDVVDATGGGVYTILVANHTRQAAVKLLNIGDSVTVVVSPLTLVSVAECSFFGLIGC